MDENHSISDLRKSLGELKSFVKFTKDGAVLNNRRMEMMRKLAGRFLIVTNTDLNEEEAVKAYKEQWRIERSFRTIKSFIDIRPVYHWKPERIRAHVFICVLSLLLSRIMEKKTGMTIDRITSDLEYLDVVPIHLEDRILYLSSENRNATSIIKALGLPYPRIFESAHT